MCTCKVSQRTGFRTNTRSPVVEIDVYRAVKLILIIICSILGHAGVVSSVMHCFPVFIAPLASQIAHKVPLARDSFLGYERVGESSTPSCFKQYSTECTSVSGQHCVHCVALRELYDRTVEFVLTCKRWELSIEASSVSTNTCAKDDAHNKPEPCKIFCLGGLNNCYML